jgi:hypothetical protein
MYKSNNDKNKKRKIIIIIINIIIIYTQAVDGGATKAEFAAPHLSPTCACHT